MWKDVILLAEEVQEFVRRGEVDVKETDCDGNSILHKVCSLDTEKSEVVGYLISIGAAVNQVNRESETPLIICAGKGHLSTLRVLLNNGACVDPHGAVKQGHDSAILAAVENGQGECAEELMKHGADVWYKNSDGSNVLMVASRKGFTDIVKQCVKQGASNDINEVDKGGRTALFHACQNGHVECVKILLESEEYSKHLATRSFGEKVKSPLVIAAKEKHEACVLELLSQGASMTDKSSGNETLLMTASANGLVKVLRKCLEKLDEDEIQTYDSEGRTAIMYACESKQSDCLDELLNSRKCSKATINRASNFGFTALMICAQNGFIVGLKLLIQHSAVVDHVISTRSYYYNEKNKAENKDGNSALLLAAKSKHEDCVRELIDCKADVWFINKIGQNLLMIAAEQGLLDTVKYCLSHGNVTQIVASDDDGKTALFYAYRNNHIKCIEALLDNDKQSSDTSRNDRMVNQYSSRSQGNLIHLACREETDKPQVIELLISNCSLIDASDSNGCTPLMLCAQNGHLDSLKVLIKHGAAIDIVQCCQNNRSTNGKVPSMNSALLMAVEAKHLECTLQLIESGADIWYVNNTGETLLTLASKVGFIQVIKHCLNKRKAAGKLFEKYHEIKINESLRLAVEHKQEDCALELVPHNTDIWDKDSDGRNVLELAAENGLLSVVKAFLNNDIPKEARKVNSQDIKCAALMAAEKRQYECVKEFLNFLKTEKLEVDMNEILNKLLSKVISQNRGGMVSLLVSMGASVNAEVDGCAPLLLCAEQGRLKTLKFLLGHGADVNVSDSNQVSPLLRAAERGHENCVSELLSNGADFPHVNKEGQTLLMLAAKNGLLTTVQFCLEKGNKAFVNTVDNKGKNAITYAFKGRRTNCLAEILSNPKCGPVKSLDLVKTDDHAISYKYEEGLNLLRKHASISHEQSRARDKTTTFQAEKYFVETSREQKLVTLAEEGKHCEGKILDLMSTGANIWCTNSNGQNLLMIAAQRGMVHVVRHCVSRASFENLHAVDKTGQTAMMLIFSDKHLNPKEQSQGDLDCLAEILKSHVAFQVPEKKSRNKYNDINAEIYEGNKSLLHVVCGRDKDMAEIVELLLKKGALANTPDSTGHSPLMTCARKGHVKSLVALIQGGADVNGVSLSVRSVKSKLANPWRVFRDAFVDDDFCSENTALLLAAKGGHEMCVMTLIAHGANLWCRNSKGENLLMLASAKGMWKIVKLCLGSGTVEQINQTDNMGNNALIKACANSKMSCLKVLLSNPACLKQINVLSKDLDMTPLMLAIQQKCTTLMQVLLQNGADPEVENRHGNSCLLMFLGDGSRMHSTEQFDFVVHLLQHGAQVNHVCKSTGQSPLTLAVANMVGMKVTEELLKRGADVNHVGINGKTALQYACERRNDAIVKLLLMHGSSLQESHIFRGTDRHIYHLLVLAGIQTELKTSLTQKEGEVPKLYDMCRIPARKHVMNSFPNSNLFYMIPRLILPKKMKDFLFFDVDISTDNLENFSSYICEGIFSAVIIAVCHLSFEFFLNYTKLATLPTKACMGKEKINSTKEIASNGDRTQDLLISTLMPH